jgi:nitrous oxidase accessory protein NosD
MMPVPRRHTTLLNFVPALVLIALALPTSAFAATNRSWVSGTGDDAKSCGRTDPCRTFAGAITKTAPGGEIVCLDPGGYGTVLISKSITIKCSHSEGGILAAGTNTIGVNISAAATDKVTLSGLDVNGAGVGVQTAGVGVKVTGAASVHILDSEISRFKAGVWVTPGSSATQTSSRVVVANSHIHDNGIGLFNAPFVGYGQYSSLTARNNLIADNTCGVATSSTGSSRIPPDPTATECGAASSLFDAPAATSILGNGIYDNGEGVFASGSDALAQVAYNQITGNNPFGMHRLDSGTLQVYTPATNVIVNNTATDPPNSMLTQTRRQAKMNRKRYGRRVGG